MPFLRHIITELFIFLQINCFNLAGAVFLVIIARLGEVSEWLKEHAWKVCIRLRVSRVRIPLSPPNIIPMMSYGILKDLNHKGLGLFFVLCYLTTSIEILFQLGV